MSVEKCDLESKKWGTDNIMGARYAHFRRFPRPFFPSDTLDTPPKTNQGRSGDRPMSMHQKFNAMVGIKREASREEEIQVLDSLNDDPLLRLHYGLHVTFQVS